jgi:chorismate dehydratase
MSLSKGVNAALSNKNDAACSAGADFVSIARFMGNPITNASTTRKPRLAASSYLNTAPLIWSFKHGSVKDDVELVEAVPARCAELLAQGQVDIALVPAIEYQRIPDLAVVPSVCIGSREKVRSVILVSKLDNLKNIRKVALDESSRTSAALVKIIFREFVDCKPEWVAAAPDVRQMLADNDAALVIGDPAMTFAPEGLHVFDMASLWRKHTGLGFVFALWMISPDASSESRAIDFKAACSEGLDRRAEIVEFYLPLLGLSRDELQTYLLENISFFLDHELRAGLDLFFQLALKHSLIPVLTPLKL